MQYSRIYILLRKRGCEKLKTYNYIVQVHTYVRIHNNDIFEQIKNSLMKRKRERGVLLFVVFRYKTINDLW